MEEGKACSLCIFFSLSILLLAYTSHSQTPILKPSLTINLPPNATGPEAFAFFPYTRNPNIDFHTSVSDGRVLRYVNGRFRDFATTAPNRSTEGCDGKSDPSLEPICGRPLGLGFDRRRGGILYIADAYFGLMAVGPGGGKAQQLAAAADGVRFRSLNALDVDQNTGIVYFTDASTIFNRSQIFDAIEARDATGRLLKYDPRTKNVTVLLKELAVPVGLAVSSGGDFVVFSEISNNLTRRYWTKGQKTGQSEVFAQLSAPPDNIRRNARGDFWVALNDGAVSFGQRLDGRRGEVQQTLIFDVGNQSSSSISEVHEYKGRFYVGSFALPFVSVF